MATDVATPVVARIVELPSMMSIPQPVPTARPADVEAHEILVVPRMRS